MQTQTIPIADLGEAPNNPRLIKGEKFRKLCQSLLEDPQMLDARGVVHVGGVALGGNMRLRGIEHIANCSPAQFKAMITERTDLATWEEVRRTKSIPTRWLYDASHWTEKQREAFVVKDNVGFGEWNWEMLADEWDAQELADWGLDFPADWAKETELAPEETELAPEEEGEPGPPPAEPETVLGDVYELNGHRLVCGDSTDADVVAKCLNGAKPHLMVTDPPYGVKYVGKTKDALTIENDAMDADGTHELWRDTLSAIWPFLIPGGVIYATVPARPLHIGFAEAMLDLDALRQIMVWDKGTMVLGHSDYHYAHEPILYGWKPGAAHYFVNDRTKTTVFKFAKPAKNELHPTMKPIELWEEFIQNSSNPGDSVYEPFSGSGTTIIACERTNRTAHAIELSQAYVDVTVRRWVKYMKDNDRPFTVKRNGTDITTEDWINP